MRTLTVTCDCCGATMTTDEVQPTGWWLWHEKDYCPTCVLEEKFPDGPLQAIRDCSGPQ